MKLKREYFVLIIILLVGLILSSFIKPLMEGMEDKMPPILEEALKANPRKA
jgi:hypothetical protein